MNQGQGRPPIDVREFEDYVRRAEARFAADAHPETAQLLALYRQLRLRFERDLGADSRDAIVSRAAALMLIQCRAESRDAHDPPG
ncbi:hypothetical protein FBR04_01795 [Betaproteobacteria bacterium PRO7]|nr:hypothetical protein [Betaproteobacteria bacterium PRO7]